MRIDQVECPHPHDLADVDQYESIDREVVVLLVCPQCIRFAVSVLSGIDSLPTL